MKKFKLMVSKVYYEEVQVLAEDEDHAKEIASEYCEHEMETNWKTHVESEWKVKEIPEFKDGLVTLDFEDYDYD